MRTVAALYIDPRGPYPKMAAVDCWDEARDASGYRGGCPVVAHPPCGGWGSLAHMRVPNRERRTQDKALGPLAVAAVRRNGGVLEQPARSRLWSHCGLPRPGEGHDEFGGYSIEVAQVSWGHVARKLTWLYLVGVTGSVMRAGLRRGGTPTHWVSGGRNPNRKGSGGLVPTGIKVCSAQQRRRTPPAFAEWLVSLARSVQKGTP